MLAARARSRRLGQSLELSTGRQPAAPVEFKLDDDDAGCVARHVKSKGATSAI
jgi:hypothetical protein